MSATDDDYYLDLLLGALYKSLSSVYPGHNCGITENWKPIVTLCSFQLMKNNFEFNSLVKKPCIRTLPESLQGLDAYHLIARCLNPLNDINKDSLDAKDLQMIFLANDADLVLKLEAAADEDSLFSLKTEAAAVRDKIHQFLRPCTQPESRHKRQRQEEEAQPTVANIHKSVDSTSTIDDPTNEPPIDSTSTIDDSTNEPLITSNKKAVDAEINSTQAFDEKEVLSAADDD